MHTHVLRVGVVCVHAWLCRQCCVCSHHINVQLQMIKTQHHHFRIKDKSSTTTEQVQHSTRIWNNRLDEQVPFVSLISDSLEWASWSILKTAKDRVRSGKSSQLILSHWIIYKETNSQRNQHNRINTYSWYPAMVCSIRSNRLRLQAPHASEVVSLGQ